MNGPLSIHPPVRLRGFLGGVFLTQIVDSALHLAQPLLLAKISGSLGGAAFFSAFDTGVHMAGTYLGGWPTDRYGARRVLVASTFLRAVVLAWIPVMMVGGFMNLWLAMGCYTLEALIRGFVDTSVHTVPLELARHRTEELDRINSRYELTFDLGGVAGPLMLGGLMLWGGKIVPHVIIPAGFVLSSVFYLFIPERQGGEAVSSGLNGHVPKHGSLSSGGTWAGIRHILTHRPLLVTCLGLMSFSIYPLRKLLSAFFAKGLLHRSASVGHVGAAFALGGVVGALIYSRTKHRDTGYLWVALGAAGTFLLAVGWMPANLWIMVAAVFLFGVSNVCARLALTRKRQELTPLEHAGGVTSASQFGVNAVSVVMKAAVGAAFSIGMGAYGAFGIVGGILGLMAIGQLILARSLSKGPRAVA
jgi:predicted MFS family arabinose efflux permease